MNNENLGAPFNGVEVEKNINPSTNEKVVKETKIITITKTIYDDGSEMLNINAENLTSSYEVIGILETVKSNIINDLIIKK